MSDQGYQGCCDGPAERARWPVVALVRGARQQDSDCWEAIVTRFGPGMHRLARSYRLDQATCADIVQQAWLTAFVHLHSLRDPLALGGWLQMIVRRECLRVIRHRVAERTSESGPVTPPDGQDSALDLPDDRPLPEDHVVEAELADLIAAARARLADRDQQMLALIAAGTLSYVEMASALGLRLGSVGPTRGRCLGRPRTELAELGVDRGWLAA